MAAPLSAELERQLAAHREQRNNVGAVSSGMQQKQFTASIDEDAAQRWRKRSGEHRCACGSMPLSPVLASIDVGRKRGGQLGISITVDLDFP